MNFMGNCFRNRKRKRAGSETGRFWMLTDIVPPEVVCARFRRVKSLKEISVKDPGWTLGGLNVVRRIVSEGQALRGPNFPDKMGRRGTPPSDTFIRVHPCESVVE
jgi:hypothetical protein